MLFPALSVPESCYTVPLHHSLRNSTSASPQASDFPTMFIPAAMEMKGGGWQNAVIGPVLQCLEAATLGMPFEVGLGDSPAQVICQKCHA